MPVLTRRVIAILNAGNNHQNIGNGKFFSGRTFKNTGREGPKFAVSRARLGK